VTLSSVRTRPAAVAGVLSSHGDFGARLRPWVDSRATFTIERFVAMSHFSLLLSYPHTALKCTAELDAESNG